jgi:RecB family exonuclease
LQELENKIRPVTEEDKQLPVFSYSKLEVYKNCPMQYKLKYIDKQFTKETSLALELGSLCHYVLETKGKNKTNKLCTNYDSLYNILCNGTEDNKLIGINALKKKYFETWYEKDNASGMTYDEKMNIFKQVIQIEMEDTEWMPTFFEYPFKFVWDNQIILKGFIDRIDTRIDSNGELEYRTIDYKTSKKIYDNPKLATSLQFGIYALAILNEFKKLPIQSEYHFILLNQNQMALTKGYEKRLIKALDKLFINIKKNEDEKVFTPSPTPLCYWCSFCRNNPSAMEYQTACDYFSLWTPTEKTFNTNMKWNALDNNKQQTTRKLIF